MKTVLLICILLAATIAIWSGATLAYFCAGLALVSYYELCYRRDRIDLACIVGGVFFISCGFLALHDNLIMTGSDSAYVQLTTFVAPVALVLLATLVFCIGLVERAALRPDLEESSADLPGGNHRRSRL
ncbi:hypothetical protein [Pseudidiomarina insulisalsae]|uniref:Uncharacterized protein n=1 Tax=Pseudidiomarina insulisalsae TaxID=575789 RepID=A0A432YLH7_9GAMM|nr:hypothetical protein [Pseudidiomarina insulisalsae]RUO61813.1 hypothetical protein CWI71_05480 [Pseudidiomarina insulisalsae]